VVVSADGGWKYLSSGAWTDDIDVVTEPGPEHDLLLMVTRRRKRTVQALPDHLERAEAWNGLRPGDPVEIEGPGPCAAPAGPFGPT